MAWAGQAAMRRPLAPWLQQPSPSRRHRIPSRNSSSASGLRPIVSRSTSTNTGCASQVGDRIAGSNECQRLGEHFAIALNTDQAQRHLQGIGYRLTTATPNRAPENPATRCSNSVTFSPTEETKFESMQATRSARSVPAKTGRWRGMNVIPGIDPTHQFNQMVNHEYPKSSDLPAHSILASLIRYSVVRERRTSLQEEIRPAGNLLQGHRRAWLKDCWNETGRSHCCALKLL